MAKQPEIKIDQLSWSIGNQNIVLWQSALRAAYDVDYPQRYRLHNLYHDLLIDTHLSSVLDKRTLNLQNKRIRWNTGSEKPNTAIDNLINHSNVIGDLLKYVAEFNYYGYSLLWVDVSMPGAKMPTVELIDRRHVIPEKGVIVTHLGNITGTSYLDPAYTPWTLILGKPTDFGLLYKCAPWVIYKRGDISDWATFNEVFGMPFRKGTYTRGDMVAKKELEKSMVEQGAKPWAVLPEGSSIDIISNNAGSNSKDSFKELAQFANEEISKAVLGNTMTTDAQGGNYKGEVHAEDQSDIFAADEITAVRILNQQLTPLLQMHGYNPGNGFFEFVYEDTLDIDKEVDMLSKLADMVDIDQDYIREKFKLPAPKAGAEAAKRSKQPEPVAVPEPPKPQKGKAPEKKSALTQLADRVTGFFA